MVLMVMAVVVAAVLPAHALKGLSYSEVRVMEREPGQPEDLEEVLLGRPSEDLLLTDDIEDDPVYVDDLDDLTLHNLNNTREGRFLFSLVKIKNTGCPTFDGFTGNCQTASECSSFGGTVKGSCAKGYGVCCYKEVSCRGTATMNNTYLVSPGYPDTYTGENTCEIYFRREEGICQLRLEFYQFSSYQPTTYGLCSNDQFTVDGERKFTYLCGETPSSDWHFLLDVNGHDNPTKFIFKTDSSSFNRKFKIRVSTIECEKNIPGGCGQYHTGVTGKVMTFNYGSGYYLGGFDYAICFRREKGKCITTLTTNGPSFTACNNDLWRMPVGRYGSSYTTASLNIGTLYCQLPAAASSLDAVATVQSPLFSVSNGPFTIMYQTSTTDTVVNYRSNNPSTAGVSQTFKHNDC